MSKPLSQVFSAEAFPARIKAWRISKGYTQREAADYLGAALQTYQHWEQGRSVPTGAAMRGIERVIIEDQQPH